MARSLREAAGTKSALEEIRLSTDRIIESMSCGLVAVDAAGTVRSVNAEARRLLELPELWDKVLENLAARNAPRGRGKGPGEGSQYPSQPRPSPPVEGAGG